MPLKERTTFTLSTQVKNELESIVPKSRRSRFIEQAIIDALKEKRQKIFLGLIDNIEPVGIDLNSGELVNQLRERGINRVRP
jgi:predicted transcriptional regulator